MNLLDDLSGFLRRHYGQPPLSERSPTATESATERSLLSDFYSQLWKTDQVDEDALAAELYGSGADRTTNSYKKLKQRLINHMAGEVLLIDLGSPAFTPVQRGFFAGHRDYSVAEVLRSRNVRTAAAFFHRRALRNAVKFDITSLKVLCLEALRYHAAIIDRNTGEFEEYNRRYHQARFELEAESQVSESFSRLILGHQTAPRQRLELHKRALQDLADLDAKYDLAEMGYKYSFPYFLLKLFCWYSVSDHEQTLAVADEALAYFRSLPFSTPVSISSFLMHKLVVHTLRKEFEAGAQVHAECEKLVEPGLANWFKLQEHGFLMMMHRGDYAAAYGIYRQITAHRSFTDLAQPTREKWMVYRAYLHYLAQAGAFQLPTDSEEVNQFRLAKFLNSVPSYATEKRGRNIPILTVQILLAILRQDYAASVERIEAIEKYSSRYLQRDENFRSNTFIKLLVLFMKADFHPERLDRRSEKLLEELRAAPLETANQSYELEIVPYEVLWEIAVGSVKAQKERI